MKFGKQLLLYIKNNICLIGLVKQFNRTNKIKNIFESCFLINKGFFIINLIL